MKTLPDFVDQDLQILSIGLNPSPNSVRDGFPFATLQNRFWRALNQSTLVGTEYPPSRASMQRLLQEERIGFTDLVKRPTRGVSDLRAADYRKGGSRLLKLINRLRPRILWFHGKVAYGNFVRYGLLDRERDIQWGEQRESILNARVFVSPNPSPANAVYSLGDITEYYDVLAALRRLANQPVL